MTNHFSPNPDDRYWGQDRYHKYDAPLNPVIARQKPWKVTLDTESCKAEMDRLRVKMQYENALKKYLRKASACKKKLPKHLEEKPTIKETFQSSLSAKFDAITNHLPRVNYRYE